uniref:Uncharacterized protein n=1 Tax=Moniliophthora roreri TaxID=221103 RepID=A0A0W0G6W4_MONRR
MKNLFGHRLWKPKSRPSPPPVVSIIEDPSQNVIFIPVEEDIRRLFAECKVGIGNAGLLRDALLTMTPDDLRAASEGEGAGAERSRRDGKEGAGVEGAEGNTEEERLLAELLEANEELNRSLEQHDDLERVLKDRNVEGEDTSAMLQGHDTSLVPARP